MCLGNTLYDSYFGSDQERTERVAGIGEMPIMFW